MDNATPNIPDIQATFDYWATVEADDLTQIAGEESAVLTEQAFPPADPNETVGAADALTTSTPTITSTAVAYQLPNTGTGGGGYASVTLLIILVVFAVVSISLQRRFQS